MNSDQIRPNPFKAKKTSSAAALCNAIPRATALRSERASRMRASGEPISIRRHLCCHSASAAVDAYPMRRCRGCGAEQRGSYRPIRRRRVPSPCRRRASARPPRFATLRPDRGTGTEGARTPLRGEVLLVTKCSIDKSHQAGICQSLGDCPNSSPRRWAKS